MISPRKPVKALPVPVVKGNQPIAGNAKTGEEKSISDDKPTSSYRFGSDDIPSTEEAASMGGSLDRKHGDILLSNDWLDDKLVNAGQALIKELFPNVCGLQDVSLGQTLAFDVMKEGFVQVLHTGRGHCVHHWLSHF